MRKLKKIYLEITNVCNLACEFCPPTKRKAKFMEYETFAEILRQIKPHTDYVYLHVKGEPLLHPELGRFLDLCKAKGFHVNITTNGTLIEQVGEMLLTKSAVRQINFSMHSVESTSSKQNREEYVKQITAFAKEAMQKTAMQVSLRLWNLQENEEGKLEYGVNRELLELIAKEFSWAGVEHLEANGLKGIALAERIYLNQDVQFAWPDITLEEEDKTGFCYGLRHQAAILVDGTVLPCCLDSDGIIALGNIHKNTFSEIMESERAVRLLEGFSKRQAVEELCRKCGYRKRFDNPYSS